MPGYLGTDPALKPELGAEIDFAHELAEGLAGAWLFNEGTGSNVTADASGKRLDGTLTTGSTAKPSWAPGNFLGPALSFPGSTGGTGYVNLPSIPGTFTSASIVMWLKNDLNLPVNNNDTGLCRFSSDTTLRSHYPFTDGSIYLSLLRSARVTVGNVGIDKSQWHQLAVVSSPTAYTVYQNGAPIFSGASPGSFSFANGCFLGASENVYIYKGKIDHVYLWTNRALTAGNVSSLYTSPHQLILPRATKRFFVPTSAGGNTGTLGLQAQAATASFNVQNTPPAIAGTLGAPGQAATAGLGVQNTPPPAAATLGATAQSGSGSLDATNTPPAATGTLSGASQAATGALQAQNTSAGSAATLGAIAAAASGTLSATNTPPAATATLGASGPSALGSFVATATPPATTGTLGASAATASASLAASGVLGGYFATAALRADPSSGPFGVEVDSTLVEVDIREALYAQLAADATLAALVGANIYPIEIPEGGTTPAITYKVISDVHYLDLDGPNDTARARVQLAAISEDYDECLPVIRRLRRVFHGFSGDMHGVTVTSAYQDAGLGAKDSAMPMRDGSGTLRYILVDDFRIHYRTPPG